MKSKFLLVGCLALLLFFQENSFAQRKPRPKDALVFEISKFSSPGGGGMGRRFQSSNAFYFYASGRIACQVTRYDPRGKEIKSVKSKCVQLTKSKITELIELAGQTDFLEAEENYSFFSNGVDYGKTFDIIYYGKTGKKKIHFGHRRLGSDAPLPPSVTTFLEKLAEIDETMRVKREFPVTTPAPEQE